MIESAPSTPPQVFDRLLLRRRLARSIAAGGEDFLLARAADDLIDRLSTVKRSFAHVLDLGTPRPAAAQLLRTARPEAALVRAVPVNEAIGAGDWLGVVADEESQPFRPEAFDLAVSLLALHAVNDLPGTLVQVRRALKPDGLFLACLLGGATLHELRESLFIAEVEIMGGAGPRVAPFSDLRDLGGLLQRAGFALPVTDIDTVVVRYATPFSLFADLRAMGAANALILRQKTPTRRDILLRAAAVYAERFADRDARIRATFEIVWLSGWAPHDSQQKPLRPGSAKQSLASVLGRASGA